MEDLGLIPGLGRSPWRRERLPNPVFWPGEFYGLYSPWARKELDTTEGLSLSLFSVLGVFMVGLKINTWRLMSKVSSTLGSTTKAQELSHSSLLGKHKRRGGLQPLTYSPDSLCGFLLFLDSIFLFSVNTFLNYGNYRKQSYAVLTIFKCVVEWY